MIGVPGFAPAPFQERERRRASGQGWRGGAEAVEPEVPCSQFHVLSPQGFMAFDPEARRARFGTAPCVGIASTKPPPMFRLLCVSPAGNDGPCSSTVRPARRLLATRSRLFRNWATRRCCASGARRWPSAVFDHRRHGGVGLISRTNAPVLLDLLPGCAQRLDKAASIVCLAIVARCPS